jgi:phosphopantothenoylcysteine decarboxylase/phosphopantothenate--cysteine ligase
MRGKRVLVTTGPTREDIDPVRYITNRSSGKMGLAVARAFRNAGAHVTLIHGPVTETLPARMRLVPIRTAAEMAEEVFARYTDMDIIVKTAAVADYRPVKQPHKLKKENFDGNLVLQRTTDILDALGKNKKPGTILAGFAAESENVVENARAKLDRKGLDFIFANDITRDRAGFGSDHNHLLALRRDGRVEDLGFAGKEELAQAMVALMAESLD